MEFLLLLSSPTGVMYRLLTTSQDIQNQTVRPQCPKCHLLKFMLNQYITHKNNCCTCYINSVFFGNNNRMGKIMKNL